MSAEPATTRQGGLKPSRGLLSCAVGIYLLAAFGQIPFYFVARSLSGQESDWAGTTAFDQFLGPGLIYFGSAAVCAWMLLRRNAKAVWASWIVVTWVALEQVAALRSVMQGRAFNPSRFYVKCVCLALFVLLALSFRRLQRRGVLR